MKKIILILLIIGLITILFVSCIPSVPPIPSEGSEVEEVEPTTSRVVLVELFNTQGCPACAQINPIVEEVAQEYDKSQVILIEEAGWGLYSTPETSERYRWYLPENKKRKTPNILFNGLNQRIYPGASAGGGEGNQGNSGNSGNSGDTGTVEVDTTKPVITGSRNPLPNSFGWNNTDVTVSFSCADTGAVQSGIDINTVAGATVTTEGKDQSVTNTGVCIDVAGNTADPVTISNINIDKTPPEVMITLPGSGEYVLNQSITATWSATDALSGVVSPVSGSVSIDTSSVGTKTFTLPAGTVTDKAGNGSLKVTISYLVIADTEETGTEEVDTTKPVITGSRNPLPNSFGWNNTDVTVSFSCADTGPVQSGIEINTVAGETLTTEGKDQSVTNTGVCIDVAGNTADPVTISNINIDKTPPEVMITLPGTGEYVSNQSITATWSATDALSGVVSPVSGTVSIDTSSVGTKTFTMPAGTVMDKAGNGSLKVTISYSVIADSGEPGTVYPQQWASGDGTVENPWANDCINTAYTNCPVGGTIFLRAGYYKLDTLLNITKALNIIGEGMGKTFIVLGMTDSHGLRIAANYVTLKGFTVDGDSQTDGLNYRACIATADADYALVENIEVKNAGVYGMNLSGNHCLFQNIYAHDNYRHGLHPGSDTAGSNIYNTYRNIYCWNNGADGFDDSGTNPIIETNNVYDNIHCWDNGENGINLNWQSGAILSNSTASGNGRNGMNFHTLNNFTVNSCSSTLNDERGIYLINSKNINFTNVIIKNSVNNGIALYGSSNIVFTSCQSYDDRVTLIQRYGIELKEGCSEITVLNCKLTPNKVGDIDNPYNVAIVVITEKMLAKF